ncbi:MAG TPA: carboxypeptidase-like regulatory domain-containing protein, partial [Cyclobacteriaceae bacterium]|nr:carboxypeptidase-like regulatory domain-containing protein [Cyclobacteriaceae bacterium]
MRGIACLFVFASVGAGFAQTGVIHGTVTDAKSGEVLPFTNIFISNTTIGTSADDKGNFRLMRVPVGPNELVFSFVGYKSVQTKIDLGPNQELTLNAQLAPDEELLETVVVEGKRDKVWQAQLKQFTRSFLGKYVSAEEVKIVNPEVLEFREVGPVLFATATEAIQIENNKLGYTIFYFLKKFHSTKGDDYAIIGNARFEEMKTYEPKVAAKWADNRWEAYQGSMRHLFSSILKSQTRENGFELYNDKTGFENSPRSSLFRAELGKTIESYDTSKLEIVPDASKQLFRIIFKTNRLEVHNTKVSSKVRNY